MEKNHSMLERTQKGAVAWLTLQRPEKKNALHPSFWPECVEMFSALDQDPQVRAVVISAAGDSFCAGLDLNAAMSLPFLEMGAQTPRQRIDFAPHVRLWQEAFTAIERCRKPVIAAIHGACIGGGLDLAASCDIRLCAQDAVFSLREAAMAMVADLGSLQRLPLILGQGLTRELAFTARDVDAQEALHIRLVNRCFPTKQQLWDGALQMAEQIAAQSPLAVQSSKDVLNYSRDTSTEHGLHYAATRNAMIMPSEEL
ncbi:MAG: enoyl-CoA hydratase-related protein, partial [Myxococcota bacterium]